MCHVVRAQRNVQQDAISGKVRHQRHTRGTEPMAAALGAFTREDAAASMTRAGEHDDEDERGDDGMPPDAVGLQSDGDAEDFGPPDMGGGGDDDWDAQPPLWHPSGLDAAEVCPVAVGIGTCC